MILQGFALEKEMLESAEISALSSFMKQLPDH
jgi:hypothetical protein